MISQVRAFIERREIMTQKTLDKLPEKIRKTIELWKDRIHDDRFDKKIAKGEARGYIKALVDTNTISEQEFKTLFCYMTV